MISAQTSGDCTPPTRLYLLDRVDVAIAVVRLDIRPTINSNPLFVPEIHWSADTHPRIVVVPDWE